MGWQGEREGDDMGRPSRRSLQRSTDHLKGLFVTGRGRERDRKDRVKRGMDRRMGRGSPTHYFRLKSCIVMNRRLPVDLLLVERLVESVELPWLRKL